MSIVYPEELIEELRSRNDIVDIISGYVSLKKSGSSFKGKCPFHTENTPSFTVSADKQLYHCFGCGVGGNVINFVMDIENLSFVDALKFLANRAGMILPEKDGHADKEKYKAKQIQYNIHTDAARYFHKNLISNKEALIYLNRRNISSKTITKFGLGYARDEWEDLYKYLLSKKYSIDDIAKSGLVLPKKSQKNQFYDRFRNRIIFPVFNLTNKVIGFGGRVLDQQLPKYLNSPETIIFSKGDHLYGLNNAKNYTKDGQLIIVEGYMDVISLYQHGLRNVVASLGTALTKGQARLLNRYANEIIIAYDGDEAGQKATLRALEVLASVGCKVKVLQLPKGIDPDEYIKKYKMEGFVHKINKGISLVEYKILLSREKYNIDTTEGKIGFTKEVAEILKNIQSEIEIDAYIQKISKEAGINEAAIKAEVFRNKKTSTAGFENKTGKNRNTIQYKKNIPVKKENKAIILAEENLLNAISQDLALFQKIKNHIHWEDFTDETHKKIAKILFEKMNNKEIVIPGQLLDIFRNEEESRKIAAIFTKELDKELMGKNIMEYINTIKTNKIQNQIDELNDELKILSEKNDTENSNKIYIEIIGLKKKLEDLKGN